MTHPEVERTLNEAERTLKEVQKMREVERVLRGV